MIPMIMIIPDTTARVPITIRAMCHSFDLPENGIVVLKLQKCNVVVYYACNQTPPINVAK